MPGTRRPPPLTVLDAALAWTHGVLQPARAADLGLPTPCAAWDLRALLVHMEDSLAALGEAAAMGLVDLVGPHPAPVADGPPDVLVDQICRRARTTRAAWTARVTSAPIGVGDLRLDRDTLALAGAVEVVAHGWDVARTVGRSQDPPADLPADLATLLLPVARALVGDQDRARRFGPAVATAPGAPAAERLLAHLGRDPGWAPRPAAPQLAAVGAGGGLSGRSGHGGTLVP